MTIENFFLCLILLFTLIFQSKVISQNINKSDTALNQICITIDDLPVVCKYCKNIDEEKMITDRLLSALKKYKVPAIGFVTGQKLYRPGTVDEEKLIYNGSLREEKLTLLRKWLDAGMELGNHTFSHIDYNAVSLKEYKEEIIKGELSFNGLLKNKRVKYFRHPFLHRGNTKEKVDSLKNLLLEIGYIEAPVTVDNSDWIFARAYENAGFIKDSLTMKKIGKIYIGYMKDKIKFYENQSAALFGYNIKQILLLHANALNAEYLGELLKMIESEKYLFIKLDEALKDKCYNTIDTMDKGFGISWIHRWAISMGKKRDFFNGEPTTPDFIMKLAEVRSE